MYLVTVKTTVTKEVWVSDATEEAAREQVLNMTREELDELCEEQGSSGFDCEREVIDVTDL